MMKISFYLSQIPDTTESRLARIYGGDIDQKLSSAFSSVLRLIAQFGPSQLGMKIIGFFKYDSKILKNRLQWSIELSYDESIDQSIITQIINNGPLCHFFTFIPDTEEILYEKIISSFTYQTEIHRQEKIVRPYVPLDLNPRIPEVYYSIIPFQPNTENTFDTLDTALGKLTEDVVIVLECAPVLMTSILESYATYMSRISTINFFDEAVYIRGRLDDSQDLESLEDDHSFTSSGRKNYAKDLLADECLKEWQELQKNLSEPHLAFNINVYTRSEVVSRVIGSTLAECGFSEGKYAVSCRGKKERSNEPLFKRSLVSQSSVSFSDPDIVAISSLTHIATIDELAGLFRLPSASNVSPVTMWKTTDPRPPLGKDGKIKPNIMIGTDLETSSSIDSMPSPFDSSGAESSNTIRMETEILKKHAFIAGVPGSGKTVATFNLIMQLFSQGIPCLVIEPAKTEYRVIKTAKEKSSLPSIIQKLGNDIRIYTPGNELLSPFRFNPFWYPEDISIDEHIDTLMNCFRAAMPMFGPLENLLSEAIELAYARANDNDTIPLMTDLYGIINEVMETKKYEGEVRSNLQAAIEVRIGGLLRRSIGKIFSVRENRPVISEMMQIPTVIEMDYLGQDTSCLLTLFVLSAVREYVRTMRTSGSSLKHVIIIEEAHNIIGRTGPAQASEDSSDPKAFAAEYISRMLAELRALGEGMVIADQLPSTVSPTVIKNTGTKIAHRLVSKDDREELGATMVMNEQQLQELARLHVGESYLYTEGFYKPRLVKGVNAFEVLGKPEFPTGRDLHYLMINEPWYRSSILEKNKEFRHQMAIAFERMEEAGERIQEVQEWINDSRKQKVISIDEIEEQRTNLRDVRNLIEQIVDDTWGKCTSHLNFATSLVSEFREAFIPEVEAYMKNVSSTVEVLFNSIEKNSKQLMHIDEKLSQS